MVGAPFHEVVVGLQAAPGAKVQATTPDGDEVEVRRKLWCTTVP